MRRSVVVLLMLFPTLLFAQGIQFFEGTFEQALQKAKKENKEVFVDFYAVWCGPCKYMSGAVFTNPDVGAYFNEHFVSVKIDAEKQEKDLVEKTNIEAYPTLAFFKSTGNVSFITVGALDGDGLMETASRVVNFEANKKAFEKNKSDLKAMTNYITVLVQQNPEEAKRIVGDYLQSVKTEDCKNPDTWSLVSIFETDPQSRFYLYSLDHFRYFIDSIPGYQTYFTEVSGMLLQDAIANKDESKVALYKQQARKAILQMEVPMPDGFEDEVDIYYYSETGQNEKHLQSLDHWIMNYVSDVEMISNNAQETMDRYGEKAFSYCIKWAEKAFKAEESAYTYLTIAYVYRANNMKAEALKNAEKASEVATDEDDKEFISNFIDELKK
ncbi:MAG: thioredoxin family protein [Flavobacteriales bacterium]|nr:thioredoxin family protein [Flavobacteriales bacterium]